MYFDFSSVYIPNEKKKHYTSVISKMALHPAPHITLHSMTNTGPGIQTSLSNVR